MSHFASCVVARKKYVGFGGRPPVGVRSGARTPSPLSSDIMGIAIYRYSPANSTLCIGHNRKRYSTAKPIEMPFGGLLGWAQETMYSMGP